MLLIKNYPNVEKDYLSYFLLDKIFDELAVLGLGRVRMKVLGYLGDVCEHEVTTFGYDGRETSVQ